MTDPPTPSELSQLADLAAQLKEATARREALKAHAPRQSPGGLLNFIRYFWDVLEPATEFVEGYVLEVMCAHLEAVTRGEIKRLLINVPPGFSKSLLVDVWWPAWEWSACKLPQMRYVSFSYSAGITERDNAKFRDLILSKKFQDLYGKDFELRKTSEVDVTNNKTGRKFASSVEGIGTGERGDRVILDDAHSVTQAESDIQRERTVEWFRRTLTNRLNSATESAIVIIMQRLHEDDISGLVISEGWDYCHLMVPMRFEPGRAIENELGYLDWRTQDGELAWPERFPEKFCQRIELEQGPFGWACTPAETPILMADLSTKPISKIRAGDEIIGFASRNITGKDGRNSRRKLTRTKVTEVYKSPCPRPLLKLTTDAGHVVRCTHDHKWYTGRNDDTHALYAQATAGFKLSRVCEPQLPELSPEEARAAAWLAGFFDGEGSVSIMRRKGRDHANDGGIITFTQGSGRNLAICHQLEAHLTTLGFEFGYRERLPNGSDRRKEPCRIYWLKGDRTDVCRKFLHLVRPLKWRERIEKMPLVARFITAEERIKRLEFDGEEYVYGLTTETGNYIASGVASANSQYQQRPAPIGGGILKREYWQMWTPDSARRLGFDGEKYPPFEIVIASLDTAATDKRERDPSACVVLGVWTDKTRCTRIMLIHAWAKRYLLSELASQVEKTCLEYRVAKVIIESTAHGHSVSQMLVDRWGNMAQRLYGNPKFAGSMVNGQRGDFGIDLVAPNVMGGKAVRVQAIQPLMAAGVVWAPCAKDDEEQFRDWAEEVIREAEVFPAGRHDDLCLIAGTMIETRRGPAAIETIGVGEQVLTPFGWRRVLAAGFTGVRQIVSRRGLIGTGAHPVFTPDGFVPLDSLTRTSKIMGLGLCDLIRAIRQLKLSSMASDIEEWGGEVSTICRNQRRMLVEEMRRGYTSPFGRTLMARRCRRITKSIIEIATLLIAALKIWSACRRSRIGKCLRELITRKAELILSGYAHSPLCGTVPNRAELGIASSPYDGSLEKIIAENDIWFWEQENASGAGQGLNFVASEPGSVRDIVKTPIQQCGAENKRMCIPIMRPVYNLTVEGAHCYYANGTLVHNCDAFTQGMLWLRNHGLAVFPDERTVEMEEEEKYRKPERSLYPA